MTSKFSYKHYPNELFYVEDLQPQNVKAKKPSIKPKPEKSNSSQNVQMTQQSETKYNPTSHQNSEKKQIEASQQFSGGLRNQAAIETEFATQQMSYEKLNLNSYKYLFQNKYNNEHLDQYITKSPEFNINLNYNDEESLFREGSNNFCEPNEYAQQDENFRFAPSLIKQQSVDHNNYMLRQHNIELSRPKSADRIKIYGTESYPLPDEDNFDDQIRIGVASSVEQYFEKRHNVAIEKMNKIREEREKAIQKEMVGRPKISANSQKLSEKLNSRRNVFDRLTNNGDERKKQEKLQKLEKMINKNQNAPEINEASKKLNRNIDHLLEWKKELDNKKERNIEEFYTEGRPKINQFSEMLLNMRNPDYLEKPVEERLLEKAAKEHKPPEKVVPKKPPSYQAIKKPQVMTNLVEPSPIVKNLVSPKVGKEKVDEKLKTIYENESVQTTQSKQISKEKTKNQVQTRTPIPVKAQQNKNMRNKPVPLSKVVKSNSVNKLISNKVPLTKNESSETPKMQDKILPNPQINVQEMVQVVPEQQSLQSKNLCNNSVANCEGDMKVQEEREKLIDVRKHLNVYLANRKKSNCSSATSQANIGEQKETNLPLQERTKNIHTESLVSSQSSASKQVNQSLLSTENKKNYEELFQNRREMLKNAKSSTQSSNTNILSSRNDLVTSTIDESKVERNAQRDRSSNPISHAKPSDKIQDTRENDESKKESVIKNYRSYISKLERECENMNEIDRIAHNFDQEFKHNNYNNIYNK